MSMHTVLALPELRGHIVEMFASQRNPDEFNAELASLARVSKAFSEPALDVLWRNFSPTIRNSAVHPIDRFIRLLPIDARSPPRLMSPRWKSMCRLCSDSIEPYH
jgi:hypothetical protein